MKLTQNCSTKQIKPKIIKKQLIITRIQNIKFNDKNIAITLI